SIRGHHGEPSTYFKASNTNAGDGFGTTMSISGDTLVVGAPGEDSPAISVNGNEAGNDATDAGAAYVFVRNKGVWTQQAYLKPTNTGAGDRFGTSVSISGDTVVVGAPGEDSGATGINGNKDDNSATDSGAAYVFVRSGTTWSQQAYLKASNTGAGDAFGTSLSISGGRIIVGAEGEDSNATGINGNGSNNSAPDSGAAYTYLRSSNVWAYQAYIKASNTGAGDRFGCSVGISDSNAVVGAWGEGAAANGTSTNPNDNTKPQTGAAYAFRETGTWVQQAYLKDAYPVLPHPTFGGDDPEWFGKSVAISGNTIVVSAPNKFVGGFFGSINGNRGATYIFVRNGSTWSEQAYLSSEPNEMGTTLGEHIAIDDNVLAVGTNFTGLSETSVRRILLFMRNGATWTRQHTVVTENDDRLLGCAVAVSGSTLI
ncbi:MAG: integrin, partial [Verrucomicrobiaceae bacterium]